MKKGTFKKLLLNQVYRYANKRFEIIHARDNKTMGMYECFMHDEYLNKDVKIEAGTLAELFKKVKAHVNSAGLSIDLRLIPEPMQYQY